MSLAASLRAEFKVRFPSGPGVLRIDTLGLHIAARSRRFGFGSQDRRFVARREIRDVYRQAENVRIGFRDAARDQFVEFWADDATAASEIVGHLPTSHTVESEITASRPAQAFEVPVPRGIAAIAAIALACVFVIVWWMKSLSDRVTLPELATMPSATRARDEVNLPSTRKELPISAADYQLLRNDWTRYAATRDSLRDDFMANFDALQRGTLSRDSFLTHVTQSLAPNWVREADRITRQTPPPDSRRGRLRHVLFLAASSWERALLQYASALAADNSPMVWKAFDTMHEAEQLELEARSLVAEAQQ